MKVTKCYFVLILAMCLIAGSANAKETKDAVTIETFSSGFAMIKGIAEGLISAARNSPDQYIGCSVGFNETSGSQKSLTCFANDGRNSLECTSNDNFKIQLAMSINSTSRISFAPSQDGECVIFKVTNSSDY